MKEKLANALGDTPYVPCLYQTFDSALQVLRAYASIDPEFAEQKEVQELMKLCMEFRNNGPLSFQNKTVIVIEGIDATGKVCSMSHLVFLSFSKFPMYMMYFSEHNRESTCQILQFLHHQDT